MRPARIREEARMRLQNTEYLRRRLWLSVAQQTRIGKLTPKEADAVRRQFWEERRADVLIVRGGVAPQPVNVARSQVVQFRNPWQGQTKVLRSDLR